MNTIKALNKKGSEMAKKPVKKAAEKKVVAKKAPAKKVVAKKAVAKKVAAPKTVKPVVKAAPAAEIKAVMEAPVTTSAPSCKCCCRNGGLCTFIRKLIVFFVIFALGFAAAKFVYFDGRRFHMIKHHSYQEMFFNGCLDTTKLPNPEMAEKIKAADVNGDNCITADEFRAGRDAARQEVRGEMPGRPDMPPQNGKQMRR